MIREVPIVDLLMTQAVHIATLRQARPIVDQAAATGVAVVVATKKTKRNLN